MIWIIGALAALTVVALYLLFRNTMNLLQYIGPVYWVTRDNGTPDVPHVALAFMRGTTPPWKVGSGIQFRWGTHTLQVGICHNGPQFDDEYEGLLHMLQSEDPDVVVDAAIGILDPSTWNK